MAVVKKRLQIFPVGQKENDLLKEKAVKILQEDEWMQNTEKVIITLVNQAVSLISLRNTEIEDLNEI